MAHLFFLVRLQYGDLLSQLAGKRHEEEPAKRSDPCTIRRRRLPWLVTKRLADEWRECQQRLTALERQYAAAMTSYCSGEGPPPADEMKKQIIRMREEAKRLLDAALQEIDRRMHEQDRKLDGY